jgi:predicted aspartyl protease
VSYELKALAHMGDVPRPVVPIGVRGAGPLRFDGLIDTGASACLLSEEIAELAGIDLDTAALETDVRGVAGRKLPARLATVTLELESASWTTEAWFCAGWTWEHQLLGMYGFLDQFEFTLNVAAGWCDLT